MSSVARSRNNATSSTSNYCRNNYLAYAIAGDNHDDDGDNYAVAGDNHDDDGDNHDDDGDNHDDDGDNHDDDGDNHDIDGDNHDIDGDNHDIDGDGPGDYDRAGGATSDNRTHASPTARVCRWRSCRQ